MLSRHATPLCAIDLAAAATAPVRRRLWQVDARYHCAIIGTCLMIDELRAIARKTSLVIRPGAPRYEIHWLFVKIAAERGPASKLLHKTLDRNFAADIARLGRRADEAALSAAWGRASDTGNILGTFWAILSHPNASVALCNHVHGEVHMLSHLQGEATQVAIGRLRQAQAACLTLEVKLDQQRRHAETTLRGRDELIAGLREQMAAATTAQPLLVERKSDRAPPSRRIQARLAALERRLRSERARARAAERERAILAEQVDHLLRAKRLATADPAAAAIRLGGRCLLYVGGRRHLVPHLRALAERCEGRLLYHDGGVEAANNRLDGLVSQADAVYCPVDCVSHDACLRLKAMCRQIDKPFVPLRSASLSAFAAALRQTGQPPAISASDA